MRILLVSSGGYGAFFLMRFMREGHSCDWYLPEPEGRQKLILSGIVPPPLDKEPAPARYDLVVFDSTGNGDLADEIRKVTPVIGDSALATKLEDDRLYGIQVMEQCGIEVPLYSVFNTPDEARPWIEEHPKRYVYKPFTLPDQDAQDSDTTYVSENADDLLRCLDILFKDSHEAPFLLQEVVEGTEVSTEGYFDGQNFFFHNHTIECKKFMAGDVGPNTGCAGNLVWATNGPSRLFTHGVGRLTEFLRLQGYRGMVDLNTIVDEQHVYGLEFTPRFGYDASPTIFSLVRGDLALFLHDIAIGPTEHDPMPRLRADWAAAARYSIPPYPEELNPAKHPKKVPIKGVKLEDAWLNFYLYDAMLGSDGGLCTAGVTGFIGAPIASAHTPEGAWDGVERLAKNLKIPNYQVRNDLEKCTLSRLGRLRDLGWV